MEANQLSFIKNKVKAYYWGKPEDFDEAFDSILGSNAMQRIEVEHTYDIDEEKLFCDIDKAIEYLKSLKLQGYTNIDQRWSGYEDNYFVAVKIELETDDEYYERLGDIVRERSDNIAARKEEEAKKQKRIKELEEELCKLKKS